MESSKSSVIILNEDEDDEQAVNMEKSWVDLSSPTIPPFVARDRSKDSSISDMFNHLITNNSRKLSDEMVKELTSLKDQVAVMELRSNHLQLESHHKRILNLENAFNVRSPPYCVKKVTILLDNKQTDSVTVSQEVQNRVAQHVADITSELMSGTSSRYAQCSYCIKSQQEIIDLNKQLHLLGVENAKLQCERKQKKDDFIIAHMMQVEVSKDDYLKEHDENKKLKQQLKEKETECSRLRYDNAHNRMSVVTPKYSYYHHSNDELQRDAGPKPQLVSRDVE